MTQRPLVTCPGIYRQPICPRFPLPSKPLVIVVICFTLITLGVRVCVCVGEGDRRGYRRQFQVTGIDATAGSDQGLQSHTYYKLSSATFHVLLTSMNGLTVAHTSDHLYTTMVINSCTYPSTLSSTTIPKPMGIPPSTCSGTPNLWN